MRKEALLRLEGVFECCIILCLVTSVASADIKTEGRAIWVTRWDYKTAGDVRRIIGNCAETGFNQIFFQVRGNGTVYYKSRIEPWAFELTSDSPETTGRDPGWDPLQVAIDEAHAREIELHAYMNVLPAWRSQKYPPRNVSQLWTRHPRWFMRDKSGNKMIPRDHDVDPKVGDWYTLLSPGISRVKKRLRRVIMEVVRNYDVDGIHLDYIRYPSEIGDFSYDKPSLRAFKRRYKTTPEESPSQWAYWRGTQVSDLLRKVYVKARNVKPELIFSAAVVSDYDRGRREYFQRSQEWIEEGILDLAVPMVYTTDLDIFKKQVDDFQRNRSGRHIYAGIGVYKLDGPAALCEQIEEARKLGVAGMALFAYSSLFDNHKPNENADLLREDLFSVEVRVPVKDW